jgi:16S rRNA (uracil1498-N3)-methyltransferase
VGDAFVAFDPAERLEAPGEIVGIDREAVTVRLGQAVPARAVPALDVTLIQCAGKGDKVDDVVRAATALGVGRILVVESERTVTRTDAQKSARRGERWNAIALDAARQSGRGDVPRIEGPEPLEGVLASFRDEPGTKLCLDPSAPVSFQKALAGAPFVLLVGPEGGFTREELTLASRSGLHPHPPRSLRPPHGARRPCRSRRTFRAREFGSERIAANLSH